MFLRNVVLGLLTTVLIAVFPAPAAMAADSPEMRDGSHDFDFDIGTWKTHSSRLLHPLSGSNDWADMDGISVVKKVWDGRANLAEYKADGPGGHIELLALRWYNPNTHQWSINFATPNVGTFNVPGVGETKDGKIDFYDQEEFQGKQILVRFSIWAITRDTAQSEQAFSDDGGKTWEVNWVNKYTRIPDQPDLAWNAAPSDDQGAHDFDFNAGTWHTAIKRNPEPFAKPDETIDINGTVTVRKVWGGRAELEEIEADGPKGHWEALTVFLYNAKAKQWNVSYINQKMGVMGAPLVGSMKDGRVELYQGDTFKDRAILVHGLWSEIQPNSHRYTESYSDDGGKTWKQAFDAHLTREK